MPNTKTILSTLIVVLNIHFVRIGRAHICLSAQMLVAGANELHMIEFELSQHFNVYPDSAHYLQRQTFIGIVSREKERERDYTGTATGKSNEK